MPRCTGVYGRGHIQHIGVWGLRLSGPYPLARTVYSLLHDISMDVIDHTRCLSRIKVHPTTVNSHVICGAKCHWVAPDTRGSKCENHNPRAHMGGGGGLQGQV